MSRPELTGLAVRFLAGRFHATPWDRHVNEAAVAWPPEPWRLLRALVAVWHRKADRERFPEPVLEGLVTTLSSALPRYRLPVGVHSHLQHYMPVPKGRSETTTLVFDAFLRVDPDTPLIVWWPGVRLAGEEGALFDHLVSRLGYLGRAESWVEARTLDELPAGGREAAPWAELSAEEAAGSEACDLLAPIAAADYESWRAGALAAARELRGRARHRAEATLPERFVDLLRLETTDVQEAGWSRFPGTRTVPYGRPKEWDRPRRPNAEPNGSRRPRTTVRLALAGRPLPRIEDAVRVGEALRAAVLKQVGEREAPAVLTGRDPATGAVAAGHAHLHYLPEDGDGDGWIDHLLLHAEDGLEDALPFIANLKKLWLRDAREQEWKVFFELAGGVADVEHAASSLLGSSRTWQSLTPYLHPWHAKRGFGPAEQIARELGSRTFAGRRLELARPPEPLAEIEVAGTRRRSLHFHRFRRRRGLSQPDRHGGFWRLELSESISGPLALGFGSHFGLGLFGPAPGP